MGNVVSTPTTREGVQGWKCSICGKSFSYSQPINFGLQLGLMKLFMAEHEHDGAEQNLAPSATYEMFAADMLQEVLAETPEAESYAATTTLLATVLQHRDDDVKGLVEALQKANGVLPAPGDLRDYTVLGESTETGKQYDVVVSAVDVAGACARAESQYRADFPDDVPALSDEYALGIKYIFEGRLTNLG